MRSALREVDEAFRWRRGLCRTWRFLVRWGQIEESTMRSIQLSNYHYAAEWPIDDLLTPAQMTQLGTEFVPASATTIMPVV